MCYDWGRVQMGSNGTRYRSLVFTAPYNFVAPITINSVYQIDGEDWVLSGVEMQTSTIDPNETIVTVYFMISDNQGWQQARIQEAKQKMQYFTIQA